MWSDMYKVVVMVMLKYEPLVAKATRSFADPKWDHYHNVMNNDVMSDDVVNNDVMRDVMSMDNEMLLTPCVLTSWVYGWLVSCGPLLDDHGWK